MRVLRTFWGFRGSEGFGGFWGFLGVFGVFWGFWGVFGVSLGFFESFRDEKGWGWVEMVIDNSVKWGEGWNGKMNGGKGAEEGVEWGGGGWNEG